MPAEPITPAALIAQFRYALDNHWGYIWGTSGEKWTAQKQRQLEKTTDPERAQGRQYGEKWIGHTVADCSGLFSWAFRRLGGTMYHGSNTMFLKWCSDKGALKDGRRTDRATLKPGTAVFVWNGKTYSHVGLYVGDDTVIEAMGTNSGVTTSKVTANKWTHWGELTGVSYGAAPSPAASVPENAASAAPAPGNAPSPKPSRTEAGEDAPGDFPTIRRGDRGEAVQVCQALLIGLGYSVGPCGTDGDFGWKTHAAVLAFQADHRLAVDGVVGPATWSMLCRQSGLEKPDPASETKTFCLILHRLSMDEAQEIRSLYPDSFLMEE